MIIIVAAVLFVGCEKVVDINNDPSKELPVVNAIPTVGEPLFVYFAHTRFFLDTNNNQPLADASLTVYANDVPLALDSIVRCRYHYAYEPQEGDSLRLEGITPYGTLTARTYVPRVPTLSNISLLADTGGQAFRFYNASFAFEDHGGEAEYYTLVVEVRDSGARRNHREHRIDHVDTTRSVYFALTDNDEITGDASYVNAAFGFFYTHNYFNDSRIDGRTYPVKMQILHIIDTTEIAPFKHEYTVSLRSVTPARLRYIIDASRQRGTSSFFSEQGQVRGNVNGALGIFAGVAKSSFSFCPDTLGIYGGVGAVAPSRELIERVK